MSVISPGCLVVILAAAAATAVFTFYWKAIYRQIHIRIQLSKIPRLPIPCYPLVGHLLSLPPKSSKYRFQAEMRNYYRLIVSKKKICSIYAGPRVLVVAIHPDTAEVILKSNKNITKGFNYKFVRPWLNEGILTSTGRKWQKRRKMITPSFHYDILKDFLNIMNEHAAGFVDCIEQDILNGSQVDIKQRLKLCTLNIICETAMGCTVHAQDVEDNEYVKAVQKFGGYMLTRNSNFLMIFDFIFNRTPTGREQKRTLKTLHDFTRSVIDKKMSESVGTSSSVPPKRKALLDMLIAAQIEDGSSLSADDIQEEVDTFMFAGHDTIYVTSTWGIYILGRYPEKQKKLQDELDLVFAGDKTCDVTFDHIKDLTYLDLVVKEILRLYPAVPFVGRTLEEECVLDGYTIPKGTSVFTFIYLINRHPDIWEEPNKFIPERFETENRLKNKKSPYSYIPFSAGPRNCIGQRFAVQELKVILTKLFRRFSVTSLDEEDELEVRRGMVLEIDQQLKLKLTARES